MTFGFEDLLAANIHLDLLGFGLGLLGQFDLQHALFIVGTNLPRIDGTGQRERPSEASVLPLHAPEVLLFLFLLQLALAVHGEANCLKQVMTGLRSQRSMKRGFTPTPCLQRVTALFKGGHYTF